MFAFVAKLFLVLVDGGLSLRVSTDQPETRHSVVERDSAAQCRKFKSRNLVLGGAMGYHTSNLQNIARSFAISGLAQRAEGIMIVMEDSDFREKAAKYGMKAMVPGIDFEIDEEYELLVFRRFMNMPAVKKRWFYASQLLRKYGKCFDKIAFVDTRDLIFQADPFPYIQEGFYATGEQHGNHLLNASWTDPVPWDLQHENYNSRWINECGDCQHVNDALGEITKKHGNSTTILNGGACLGTTAAWQQVASKMLEMFLSCGECIDQGALNYLFYSGMLPTKVTILRAEDGPVLHNADFVSPDGPDGSYNSAEHEKDQVLHLMNRDRTMVAAIVHQYDRSETLTAKIKSGLEELSKKVGLD